MENSSKLCRHWLDGIHFIVFPHLNMICLGGHEHEVGFKFTNYYPSLMVRLCIGFGINKHLCLLS